MAAAAQALREYQASGERASRHIARLAHDVLLQHAGALGSGIWDIYEQAFVAGLDIGDTKLMKICKNHLSRRFGKENARVRRLAGLELEAQGSWSEAEQLYASILETDPGNTAIQKRQIAVLMAKFGDDYSPAIKALNKYLESNMLDFEAWTALANLYLAAHMLPFATFCFEELVLSNPQNYLFHLMLAETLYSIGKTEQARKYFAQAVALNSSNARALFGLHMAHSRSSKTANAELKVETEKALLKLYKDQPNESMVLLYLKSV